MPTQATLAVWVYLPGMQEANDSLLHTRDWEDGSLHLQWKEEPSKVGFSLAGGSYHQLHQGTGQACTAPAWKQRP